METQPTLVIHSPDGTTRRMAFDSDLISIGRDPDKSLRLSHAMVSRSHAELWRDSAGSVHVRDIHSRNHTFVNGELIIDRLLHDGDEIGIGPFVILLRHAKDTSKVPVGDDGARVTRLQDHAAPHIDVSQINTLKDFTRKLLDTAGEGDRAQALCDLLVGPQFRGHWAAIVRLGPTEAQAPVLLQQARAPLWVQEPYLSRGVLRTVRKNGQAVLASNVGDGSNFAVNVDISISPNERALAAIACPLRNTPAEIDVLYIMLPPVLGAPEWLALVNLTAQEFQLVESFWIARKAAEEAAIFEREIARARQIQMRLVPTEANIAGLELASNSHRDLARGV